MTDNLGKTSTHANTGEFALRVDAPVLELDFGNWSGADNQYPGVWITVPVEDEDGNYAGRTYVTVYPSADEPDPDGFVALNYGGRYYDEGMSCSDAADHEKRIDCFKAAYAAREGSATNEQVLRRWMDGIGTAFDSKLAQEARRLYRQRTSVPHHCAQQLPQA